MKPTRIAMGAGVLASSLALSACSSAHEVVEISFGAVFTDRVVVDGGDEGDSPGDYIPGRGDLLNDEGDVIGEFNVVTFVTGGEATQGRVMTGEYAFGGGEDSFVIAGAGQSPAGDEPLQDRSYIYPVVGGTGAYAGARGECAVTRKGEAYEVDCTFSVEPS